MESEKVDRARRSFLVKVAYTAPMIATISVLPSIASAGSPGIHDTQTPLKKAKSHHHHNQWNPW
jgi:hypothetical protein